MQRLDMNGKPYRGFGQPRKSEAILASSIAPEPYRWLWKHNLARKKIEMIAGAPGTGKTTISLSFSAIISQGGKWPDGTISPIGSVLIWSWEDDINDTLLPRLIACGADTSRVRFLKGSWDFAKLQSEAKLMVPDLAIIVLDPIVITVAGDSHKNAEVRKGLGPLQELAEETDSLILGITHFTKGTSGRDPVDRVTGSLAYGAASRLVMATAKDAENPDIRFFTRAKINIGPEGGGWQYELVQKSLRPKFEIDEAQFIKWGDAINGSAKEILDKAEGVETNSRRKDEKREDAKDWLRTKLKDGPVAHNAIMLDLDDAKISKRTLTRAKEELEIESHQQSGCWWWCLPGTWKAELELDIGE